jgi:OmpA-OmpF porin, OOP family
MSINLLDLVKDQVSGQLAQHAAGFLGESESSVGSALGSIMPALLGGAVQKASSPSGAQGLMDMLGGLDLGSLGNIGGLFGGGASGVNNVLNSGGGIVDMLLGNKVGGIIDIISKVSGLKSGSSSSLLKLAAPFLMSLISKQVAGKGLGFLTDLLGGQKDSIAKALPVGMGSLLGFAADSGSTARTSTSSYSGSTESSTGGNNNMLKWLLPLLLLAGLGYFLTKGGCGKKDMDAAITTVDTLATDVTAGIANTADSVTAVLSGYAKTLAGGFTLANAAKDGIESQLVTFVEDATKVVDKTTWFNFDRLLFDTGKSTLQASSDEQLKNIAEVLKAYPNVDLKIGGYTDSDGDEKANLKLSTDRAFTVMNKLVEMGVAKKRLAAEGYGEAFPVGDNATDAGKQQNRRIAVRVTKK